MGVRLEQKSFLDGLGFRIPGIVFRRIFFIHWNLHSGFQSILGFRNSLSCIQDSKALIPEFARRIPLGASYLKSTSKALFALKLKAI